MLSPDLPLQDTFGEGNYFFSPKNRRKKIIFSSQASLRNLLTRSPRIVPPGGTFKTVEGIKKIRFFLFVLVRITLMLHLQARNNYFAYLSYAGKVLIISKDIYFTVYDANNYGT